MGEKEAEKAAANIWKELHPKAIVSYDGGDALLVVEESGISSRAQRAEMALRAAGRPGRPLEIRCLSPGEMEELGMMEGSDIPRILATGRVIRGSL